MMRFMAWLRCQLGDRCAESGNGDARQRLDELKARTRRAEQQTAALRQARERNQWPSWEEMYTRDDGGRR